MYSTKQSILQLVALLKAHHIQHIVISPGSRNAPIVETLIQDSYFKCYTVVDERSAAFFAIGVILQTGKPTVVCCTSGTALLNFSSAVAEAYYQQLPLIVVSADRPQAWIGQMDGQTLPQPNAYKSMAKLSVQLPEIKDETDLWYCNRLINEALIVTNNPKSAPGPVHINIPLSEPLFEFSIETLPSVRKIEALPTSLATDYQAILNLFNKHTKFMLVVGQTSPLSPLHSILAKHSQHDQFVIITEHLANGNPSTKCTNFDEIIYALPQDEWINYAPEVLITCGGHIVSKRFKQFIRTNPPKIHLHISESGEMPDLYQALTHTAQIEIAPFIEKLLSYDETLVKKESKQFSKQWGDYSTMIEQQAKRYIADIPYSDLYVMQTLMRRFPDNVSLHLGNSSTVRNAQLFRLLSKDIKVYCNRGTNGIDGSMSTAVGYSAVAHNITLLIIGDLSFFYDVNALWNMQLKGNLRILLLNNGGGEIFHLLHGLNKTDALNKFIACKHETSAKGWCESMNLHYIGAANKDDLLSATDQFLNETTENNRPIVLEVFTSQEINTKVLKSYYNNLKQYNK